MATDPDSAVERVDRTSPWPVVVVVGIVLSEVGILFNLYPVSVTGLLVFTGSVAGIVDEAGYVARPWRLLVGLGVTFLAVGAVVVSTQVDGGLSAYVESETLRDGIVQRGYTIAIAGGLAALGGIVVPRAMNG